MKSSQVALSLPKIEVQIKSSAGIPWEVQQDLFLKKLEHVAELIQEA